MNDDIDPTMKKVFKHEFSALHKYQLIGEDLSLSEDELRKNYKKLLNSYRLLLQDATKITAIGDINQKKLFEAFETLEKQKAILYQSSIIDHAKTKRYQQIFSCILLDIDDFKAVNDNHGHPKGDLVLKETARHIAGQLRETDSVGRYGGEEFLIILPNTTVIEAEKVSEKIRRAVAEAIITKGIRVTISLGICDTQIHSLKSEDELLHKVDIALYEAKKNGKNCSVTYQENDLE
ncbi:MAG: GGDEF domain-containing protein [Methylococcaceae bacterium]|nr:GGDEF domain-containing protein [Methylococcaceae bacterium]